MPPFEASSSPTIQPRIAVWASEPIGQRIQDSDPRAVGRLKNADAFRRPDQVDPVGDVEDGEPVEKFPYAWNVKSSLQRAVQLNDLGQRLLVGEAAAQAARVDEVETDLVGAEPVGA